MMEETRRCKSPGIADGCGEVKLMKEFEDCMRRQSEGPKTMKYSGWCRDCRKRRDRATEVIKRKEQAEKEKADLAEALRLDGMFHGRPRTECDRLNRYTGRMSNV